MQKSKIFIFLEIVGLFCLCLSGKYALILNYGSDIPFLDQWDAEARSLYKPYLEGELKLFDLSSPWNEHRIVFTRIYSLILLGLNTYWSPYLQMTINSVLHVCSLLLLYFFFQKKKAPGFSFLLAFVILLLCVYPFDWENTLAGFQSQFYFLLLFSILSIYFLSEYDFLSFPWFLGIFLILPASLSLSSGFIIAASAFGFTIWQVLQKRKLEKNQILLLLLYLLIFFVGLYFLPKFPPHEVLKSKSLQELIISWGKSLSFPYYHTPYIALWLQLPVVIYIYLSLKYKQINRQQNFLFCFLIWFYLQSFALAYGRGANGASPASRYLTLISLSIPINLCVLYELGFYIQKISQNKIYIPIISLYIFSILYGFYNLNSDIWGAIIGRFEWNQRSEKNVAMYNRTGELSYLDVVPRYNLPYDDKNGLIDLLKNNAIQNILPTTIRKEENYKIDYNKKFIQKIGNEHIYYKARSTLAKIILKYPKNKSRDYMVMYAKTNCSKEQINMYIQLHNNPLLNKKISITSTNERWLKIRLKGLKNNFSFIVTLNSSQCFLQFTPPIVIGKLTHYFEILTQKYELLLFIGIFFTFCSYVMFIFRSYR